MAFDYAEGLPGHLPSGVRSMDHLETGLCSGPKRLPGSHRIRNDGPRSRVGGYQDLVRAWIILVVFSASGGVALAQIFWGHW